MLQRLNTLNKKEIAKISLRMKSGTMVRYVDSDGFVCFDTEELKNWKGRKTGRPPRDKDLQTKNKIRQLVNNGGFKEFCEKNKIHSIKDLIEYFS